MRSSQVFLSLLLILACAAVGEAQLADKDPVRLADMLAASSFRTRELAEQQLAALGATAVPALENGLKSADVEMRTRCLRLLRLVRRSQTDIELDDFVANNVVAKSVAFETWPAFKSISGETGDVRAIFAASYRSDPDLLKLVKSSPAQALTQVVQRCARLMSRAGDQQEMDPMQTLGQVGAVLFAAAAAPSAVDINTLNHLQNVLSRQETQWFAKGNAVFAKMVERILERQPNDQQTFHQRMYFARMLNLNDVLEKKIRPEVRNQLLQAVKEPVNINNLQQVTHLAKQVDLNDDIEKLLKPAVAKAAEKACQQLNQPDQFFVVFNLAQTLGMWDTLQQVMRPAFRKLLTDDKLVTGNSSRVYQLVAMARSLNMDNEVRSTLQPAMRRRMLEMVRNPNEQEVSRLYYEAQYLGMQDSIDNLLKPATHNLIVATLEKSVEVHTLQRLAGLAQMVNLLDTIEDTLKPVVRSQIKELAGRMGTNELWQFNQFYHLAQSMGLNESIEKDIKPKVIALIKQCEGKALNMQMFDPTFNLAMQMKLPETVPLALQAAADRSMNVARRAQAIQYIGQAGARSEIKKLSTLLGDRTSVGTAGWNAVRIQTEIRDVALASMIHLSGQSLIDYGYDYPTHTRAEFTSIGYTHIDFSTEQRRSEAVARWEQWQQKNKDS